MNYFSVAYNVMSSDTVDEYAISGASEIFAAPSYEHFGSGRPCAGTIPFESVERTFRRAKEVGLKTAMLFNPFSTANKEFTKEGKEEISKIANFVNGNDVDYITLCNPWFVDLFRKLCPKVKIKISSHYNCDSYSKFQFFLKHLDVDIVIISQFANKNFKLLREVTKEFGGDRLEVMCSVPCIMGCPYQPWHVTSASHDSCAPSPVAGNFPCQADIRERSHIAISSSFVRRQDLEYYRKLGINKFKIGERAAPGFVNLNCLQYYQGKNRDGLWELMTHGTFGAIEYIDFDKLDGFYDYFFSEKCDGVKYDCTDCDHCARYAKRAIKYRPNMKGKEDYHRDYLADYFEAGFSSLKNAPHGSSCSETPPSGPRSAGASGAPPEGPKS